MMELSDEQTNAVMSGTERNAVWVPAELPVGPHQLPRWMIGCHVDMMVAWASPPSVMFKTNGDPWPSNEPKRFANEGEGAWTARSSDGLVMERHYHSGTVRRAYAWRTVRNGDRVILHRPDGWMVEDTKEAAVAAAAKHVEYCRRQYLVDGFLEKAEEFRSEFEDVWATDKQNGYGGNHFRLQLEDTTIKTSGGFVRVSDGATIVLRGPWHGGSPVGWNDVHWYDVSRERNPTYAWCRVLGADGVVRKRHMPWYRRGGTFGYYFADELVLKAVAKYQPHVAVAHVYPGYGHARYEFYDWNWGAPKQFAEERLPGWGTKR